jgi:hypothetical protein
LFGARYFEIYREDVENPAFGPSLTEWQTTGS